MEPQREKSSGEKRLIGGPFEGASVPRSSDSILLSGGGVPKDHVARYRFSAGADGYVFKGLDEIVTQVTMPPSGGV